MAEERLYNSKELAARLGITPKALRRQLRRMDKYNDKKYTNYAFDQKEFDRLVKLLEKKEASNN